MLDPGFYPHAPRSVELRETHISWVFRAGSLAYKVKKPIVLPFLDYGTAERRRRMCLEEVRLNQRLAPSIYLRVVGIRHGDRGYEIGSVEDPEAVEYAVEMRPVEEERSFEVLARRGSLGHRQIATVAERLARFHAEVPVAGTDWRHLDPLVAAIIDNLTNLEKARGGILDPDRLRAARSFTASFLAASWGELERRLAAGSIRECHGDLRAEHVIAPAGAPPYIYDCIEFGARLREIDVATDLAFLVMDLVRLGEEDLARELVYVYRLAGGDPGEDRLIDFFSSYRSWVRATVACERALELESGDPKRERQGAEAREYLALGHRLAWRARGPMVLLLCGVSASGKTTVAERLAEVSGWPHLSSDLTRKGLAGLQPTERGDAGLYEPGTTTRTYHQLGLAAKGSLELGSGVIVDATFHRHEERAAFQKGFGEGAAPRLAVHCVASSSVLLRRAAERERDPVRISDAGPEIVRCQLAEWEEFDELDGARRMELCTELAPGGLAALVEQFIDQRL